MLFVYHDFRHVCSSSEQTKLAQTTDKFASADCIVTQIGLTYTNDELVCTQVGS